MVPFLWLTVYISTRLHYLSKRLKTARMIFVVTLLIHNFVEHNVDPRSSFLSIISLNNVIITTALSHNDKTTAHCPVS